jgi:hypothetical protein
MREIMHGAYVRDYVRRERLKDSPICIYADRTTPEMYKLSSHRIKVYNIRVQFITCLVCGSNVQGV